MKNFYYLAFICLTLFSCGDEVEFNSPAFQGDRNYELWRATAFSASIDENGFLTLTGTNNAEIVSLTVPTVLEGTYNVGSVDAIRAEYTDVTGTVFSTANRNPDISIYPEIGEIVIEEIDPINLTFTGTYHFIGFDASNQNTVGFSNGVFFKVPLVSGSIPANPITCDMMETAADAARISYNATFGPGVQFVDPVSFETACNNLVIALNDQRNYCSDVDNSIQTEINTLGDCSFPCDLAESNRFAAEAEFNVAIISNYIERCNQYAFYLQEQIAVCGDEEGSIQGIIDSLNCNDTDNDGIPDVFEAVDIDGNPVDTDLDGVMDYMDNDDDGDGILTQFETFDTDGNLIDTDANGVPNYLDNDDDGDLTLTIDESADPDGNGDPSDAVDTDGDGIPDYLQF